MASAPARSKAALCSAKSPCKASTPIRVIGCIPQRAAGLCSPTAPCHALRIWQAADINPNHRFAQVTAGLGQYSGIIVVSRRLYNRRCTLGGVAALEDTTTHEHAINA